MKAMGFPLPPEDLEHVFNAAGECWSGLEGRRVLFTGASGFFGSWMLESFLYAGTRLGLPFRAIAVSRDAKRFSKSLPQLACDPRVEILESDAATLPIPDGPVDYLVHSLVPDAGTRLPEMDAFFRAATDRLLDIAVRKTSRAFLLCSTGAVYQPKVPPAPFSEDDLLVPPDGPISYGQIRRRIEDRCHNALAGSRTALKIARGFAFVGPRLPLDANFAIGNFIRDALAGGPIIIQGDGTAVRSYLYASDMAAWLWRVLLNGRPGSASNVGSGIAMTIAGTAREVADAIAPGANICILGRDDARSYYMPEISAESLYPPSVPRIALREAILKTANFASPGDLFPK